MLETKLNFEQLQNYKIPAYFYSEDLLAKQYLALKNSLPHDFGIYYSMKANSNLDVVQCLKGLGAFADVASFRELQMALQCGYLGKEIEFTGPGKSKEALQLAIENNLASIVIESLQELELINAIAEDLEKRANISIRINPKKFYAQNGKLIDSSSTQFGLDEESLPAFHDKLKQMVHVDCVGLHVFTQSQFLNAQLLIQNFKSTFEIAKQFTKDLHQPLAIVNLGGGFGISYYKEDQFLDLTILKAGLADMFNSVSHLPEFTNTKFFVESGRYLAGPAGIYVAKVLYTKISRRKHFAILNGGFSHNMAACGFGQFIRRNFCISTVQKNRATENETVSLAGPSCYSLDILATDVELPRLAPGDFVVVHNSGAYGAQFSPSQFLQFEPAAEYFLKRS